MIVEQDRVKEAREDFRKQREFCKNVIAKAEVYERLGVNRDHQEMMNDIRDTIDAHKKNIAAYTDELGVPTREQETEHPVFRRLRLAELVSFHQGQVDCLSQVLSLGERTAAAKVQALETIDAIDKAEKEMPA